MLLFGGVFRQVQAVNVYIWNTSSAALTYTNNLPVSSGSFPAISISPNGQKLACSEGTPQSDYTSWT